MKITGKCPLGKINGIEINTSRLCNPGNYTKQNEIDVKYIVMHYTGNKADAAINNATYYNRESNIGASAHLFVDAKEIWLSVPLNCKAWHVGNDTYVHPDCRNANSIGIEMCTSGSYKIADKTIENAAYLCAELCKLCGIDDVDKYVIRHYDVTHKQCPAQMSGQDNAEWKAFKSKVKTLLNPSEEEEKEVKYSIILPRLYLGDNCNEVKTVQRLLNARKWVGADGKSLKVDGVLGENTMYAINAFQRKFLGKKYSYVTKKTWQQLLKG